jgi:heme/copper-type cytochrome/quinol oxidase subunit 2
MTERKRILKQIIIISVPLIIVIGLGVGSYFLFFKKPEAPPTTPAENLPQEIKVVNADFIPNGFNSFDLVVAVQNSNEKTGAKSFTYNISLLDGSNNSIFEKSFKGYLLPGETKYLIQFNQNPTIDTPADPKKINVKITDTEWKKMPNYQELNLTIRGKNSKPGEDGSTSYEASGTLLNKTPYDFRQIKINSLLFNNGKIVAVNSTLLDTVLANSERFFKTVWSQAPSSAVTSLEIQAETNIYDLSNFIERDSVPQDFSTGNSFEEEL